MRSNDQIQAVLGNLYGLVEDADHLSNGEKRSLTVSLDDVKYALYTEDIWSVRQAVTDFCSVVERLEKQNKSET